MLYLSELLLARWPDPGDTKGYARLRSIVAEHIEQRVRKSAFSQRVVRNVLELTLSHGVVLGSAIASDSRPTIDSLSLIDEIPWKL